MRMDLSAIDIRRSDMARDRAGLQYPTGGQAS
jgi:hypothetical protein